LLLASDSEESGSSSEASTLSPVSRLKLPSSTVSNIIKARKQKTKKRAEKRQEGTRRLLGALSQAITARESQPREDIFIYRAVGADDNDEKAIKDIFSLTEERGMQFVMRLVTWIHEDPLNEVLWNAIPSGEIRNEWMAINFPEDS
jgi:hypothetical protein